VIDFIDVQWWPIFNVADIAVTTGGVLLVLSTLLAPARRAPADPAE
jgi:signal peptidase II